jgi:hypothetical protein
VAHTVTPATWETEIGRLLFKARLCKKLVKPYSQRTSYVVMVHAYNPTYMKGRGYRIMNPGWS